MSNQRRVTSLGVLVATVLVSQGALATIRDPGAHLDYTLELEPELILAFKRSLDHGVGGGVRASIPVLFNGFIPKLNNSVGVTFGFDKDPLFEGDTYYVPVALQWNFWFHPIFSVAGEPGVLLSFSDKARLHPQVWGGARLHFSERVALVARVSVPESPSFSLGVSFFL